MLFGNFPYRATSGCSAELAKTAICHERVEPSYIAWRHGFPQPSPAACQFVAWLLTRNPEQRPIASDALRSAFLKPALPPADVRTSERKPSFHDTLLLAHDAVSELEPCASPKNEQDEDSSLEDEDSSLEEQSTDCGSDGDHCSTDGEYRTSL